MSNTYLNPDDDAPELDEQWFRDAHEYHGDHLVKRGKGRPPIESPKVPVTVRYDPDIVASFRKTGSGWQTRMNEALRRYMQEHDIAEL